MHHKSWKPLYKKFEVLVTKYDALPCDTLILNDRYLIFFLCALNATTSKATCFNSLKTVNRIENNLRSAVISELCLKSR